MEEGDCDDGLKGKEFQTSVREIIPQCRAPVKGCRGREQVPYS